MSQSADGATLTSRADYGDGAGTLSGSQLSMLFTNQDAPLNGTVSADCASISWANGALWTRAVGPYEPAVPAPAWAANLSGILELNALAYTSPGGNGSGDGSGTWASLMPKIAHWRGLGIGGIWLAYYNVATAHFYGIRSVYAATDPMTLDASLGSVAEFDAFVEACHGAGIKVFLDVIGHGLVNESKWVASNPEWFAGGSWGMVDYDYTSPGFLAWWATIWTEYALGHGADGYRIDIADEAWWRTGVWDDIAAAARAGGHEIAVWGEGSRYHFSQHDLFAPQTNLTASAAAASAAGRCLNTLQWSCHDSGWESAPGNYFFLRGSRAHFAYGALSTFIPLFLGGDEYDEDPVTDLPNLKKDRLALLVQRRGLQVKLRLGPLARGASAQGRHAGQRGERPLPAGRHAAAAAAAHVRAGQPELRAALLRPGAARGRARRGSHRAPRRRHQGPAL